MLSKDEIDAQLLKHYEECAEGLVDKSPSQLNRGEGTEVDYYILKVDIARSTILLRNRHRSTYLKFAHTFLSTVDWLTQRYGADERQVEYAGDSVQAYFPANDVSPEDVLVAAAYCRHAARAMRALDSTLAKLPINTRTGMHRGFLVLANIGPWGATQKTAIGHPLHVVGHLEKNVGVGAGVATKDFAQSLNPKNRMKYLAPMYEETKELVLAAPSPAPPPSVDPHLGGLLDAIGGAPQPNNPYLGGLLAGISSAPQRNDPIGLSSILAGLTNPGIFPTPQPTAPPPTFNTVRTLKHYEVRWNTLDRDLKLV